jgi:hypothetical protein
VTAIASASGSPAITAALQSAPEALIFKKPLTLF